MNFLPLKEITEQNNVNSKDAELYLITHERGWIYNGAASLERSESILILLSRQRLAAGADENRPALMFCLFCMILRFYLKVNRTE